MEERWWGCLLSSSGFMELILFPTWKSEGFTECVHSLPNFWNNLVLFYLHSWGFCYSWAKVDEFQGKYKTNILSWNFSWLFSLLAHLHLLKFKFWALHFVCRLCALINKVDVCVATTEIVSLKDGEVFLVILFLPSHQFPLWCC